MSLCYDGHTVYITALCLSVYVVMPLKSIPRWAQNQREMSTTNFNTILRDTMPCLICLGFFKTHFIMINVHMNYTTYQLELLDQTII